jgi:hypothetical protein
MERQEFDFKAEVIKERAETGSSFYCAVCGKKKHTEESKTCQECAKPGIAKDVDQAVKDYQKPAKTQAKEKKITRLSKRGWEALLEKIKDTVGEIEKSGKKCPDWLIIEDLEKSYPDFADELYRSLASTFRKRQKGRELFYWIFDINSYYSKEDDLVEEILDLDRNKGFSREMISHIVDEQVLIEMKKLVKGKVTARDLDLDSDSKTRVYKRACQISNDNNGIYGFFFKKLMRAIAEEMQELEESLERNESEKREREKVHKKKRAERKIKQDDRRQEILSRLKVNLWTRSGQKKFGFLVYNKDEAALLNDKTIVVLDECAYQVVKTNGGNVNLKHSNLLFSDPISRSSQPSTETKQKSVVKPNTAWVMCQEVASEAVEVFRLTEQQMKDAKLISGLPPNSYVVEDLVHINNVPLFEVRSGTLIKIGPCRQASRQERNSSDEYLPKFKRNS